MHSAARIVCWMMCNRILCELRLLPFTLARLLPFTLARLLPLAPVHPRPLATVPGRIHDQDQIQRALLCGSLTVTAHARRHSCRLGTCMCTHTYILTSLLTYIHVVADGDGCACLTQSLARCDGCLLACLHWCQQIQSLSFEFRLLAYPLPLETRHITCQTPSLTNNQFDAFENLHEEVVTLAEAKRLVDSVRSPQSINSSYYIILSY